MPVIRKREIENLEQMSPEEVQAFLDSLPERQDTISDLLDYIEDELYDSECDHHLRHAMRFMMQNQLDFPKLTSWLNENGGYCDCEVMKQIAKFRFQHRHSLLEFLPQDIEARDAVGQDYRQVGHGSTSLHEHLLSRRRRADACS